jgi:hypothetical protein
MKTSEPTTTAIVLEVLAAAADAHGVHEATELGGKYDDGWPAWYAAHMASDLKDKGYRLLPPNSTHTKVTFIVENPADPSAFEASYPDVVSLAAAIPELLSLESSKVDPHDDGSPTPYHRLLDLYFADYQAASRAVETMEAKSFFQRFATIGGTFTGLFSTVAPPTR